MDTGQKKVKTKIEDTGDSSFLESFNVDMENKPGMAETPHYIVNLNGKEFAYLMIAFNDTGSAENEFDRDMDPTVSISDASTSAPKTKSKLLETIPAAQLTPLPKFKASGRGGRNRLRVSLPLSDVMESKIRVFEGTDCSQHVDQLHKVFHRFKRAYINRIFTRNLFDFKKTHEQLKAEHAEEEKRLSGIRLVARKKMELKRNTAEEEEKAAIQQAIARLDPQTSFYLDQPISHCPAHLAGNLYRRVVVNPDGSVVRVPEDDSSINGGGGNSSKSDRSRQSQQQVQTQHQEQPEEKDCQPTEPIVSTTKAVRESSETSTDEKESSTQQEEEHEKEQQSQPEAAALVAAPADDSTSQDIKPTLSKKFFRSTNRVCEIEAKKRESVNRMLQSGMPSSRKESSSDAASYMATMGVVTANPRKRGRLSAASLAITAATNNSNTTTIATNSRMEVVTPQVVQEPEPEEELPDDGLDMTLDERAELMQFFNEAQEDELCQLSGCSAKTAQLIASLRPYESTSQLVARMSETRFLSPNLIDACQELLQMRSTVTRLLDHCERIIDQVNAAASGLLDNSQAAIRMPSQEGEADEEESPSKPADKKHQWLTSQPTILNPLHELKPYQMVGLNWLRLLHSEQVNGILADEMGLGKTIQAIAFLASLWESGIRGPHLIICPSSTKDNWERELATWCPYFKVLVYQGTIEERKALRVLIYNDLANPNFNILLTSYAIGTSTTEDRALMKNVNFYYGVFDEAHMLKNMTSQRYKNLMNFRVQRRLLLTGTPLQNNLLELVSLLSFVMPDMFMRSTDLLKRVFQIYSKPVGSRGESESKSSSKSNDFEMQRLEQAKRLLNPFCLRRLKAQVLDQLPPKTSEVIRIPMTESQRQHYCDLVERFRQQQAKSNGGEEVKENGEPKAKRERSETNDEENETEDTGQSNVATETLGNMVVQLRKSANHQLLMSGLSYSKVELHSIAETLHLDPSHANADPDLIFEDLTWLSDHRVHKLCRHYDILSSYALPTEAIINGSGKIAWLQDNLPKLIQEGHRILIFSQFVLILDILEEFLRETNQRFLRLDGNVAVAERQELIDRFNSSSIEVFLLSTRAGGVGVNLTGADTVIIHDIDFNPYNDRQAEDRVHRLGQNKPVHIIRLISEGTVEEGIFRIASQKLQLEQSVTTESTASLDVLTSSKDQQPPPVDLDEGPCEETGDNFDLLGSGIKPPPASSGNKTGDEEAADKSTDEVAVPAAASSSRLRNQNHPTSVDLRTVLNDALCASL